MLRVVFFAGVLGTLIGACAFFLLETSSFPCDPEDPTCVQTQSQQQSQQMEGIQDNDMEMEVIENNREPLPIPTTTPYPLPQIYVGPVEKPTWADKEKVPYFGPENPGPYFIPVSEMLFYKKKWHVDQLRDFLRGDAIYSVADRQETKVKWVEFRETKVIDVPVEQVGSGIYISKKRVKSYECLAKMGLFAARNGANIVHITAQGVLRIPKVKGWGGWAVVGGSRTNEDSASGGGGSAGPNFGRSWFDDYPWLRGIPLKSEE